MDPYDREQQRRLLNFLNSDAAPVAPLPREDAQAALRRMSAGPEPAVSPAVATATLTKMGGPAADDSFPGGFARRFGGGLASGLAGGMAADEARAGLAAMSGAERAPLPHAARQPAELAPLPRPAGLEQVAMPRPVAPAHSVLVTGPSGTQSFDFGSDGSGGLRQTGTRQLVGTDPAARDRGAEQTGVPGVRSLAEIGDAVGVTSGYGSGEQRRMVFDLQQQEAARQLAAMQERRLGDQFGQRLQFDRDKMTADEQQKERDRQQAKEIAGLQYSPNARRSRVEDLYLAQGLQANETPYQMDERLRKVDGYFNRAGAGGPAPGAPASTADQARATLAAMGGGPPAGPTGTPQAAPAGPQLNGAVLDSVLRDIEAVARSAAKDEDGLGLRRVEAILDRVGGLRDPAATKELLARMVAKGVVASPAQFGDLVTRAGVQAAVNLQDLGAIKRVGPAALPQKLLSMPGVTLTGTDEPSLLGSAWRYATSGMDPGALYSTADVFGRKVPLEASDVSRNYFGLSESEKQQHERRARTSGEVLRLLNEMGAFR